MSEKPVEFQLLPQNLDFLLNKLRPKFHIDLPDENRTFVEIEDDPLRERPEYPPVENNFNSVRISVSTPHLQERFTLSNLTELVQIGATDRKVQSVGIVQKCHSVQDLIALQSKHFKNERR